MKSRDGEFNASDALKTVQAFAYNAVSLSAAILVAVASLPKDQVPDWLIWLVPLSGVINAVAFAIVRWRADNRVS